MRRKYPWERWFSCRRTVILRGVDYHCSQATMSQTIRNNASARGLSVRVTDTGTEITIETIHEEGQAVPTIRDNLHGTPVATTGARGAIPPDAPVAV